MKITGGTLQSNQTGALGSLAAVDLASGSTLGLGANQSIGSLSNGGAVVLNGHTLTLGGANNLSSTFAGSLADGSGPGTLVKAGTGAVVLTGNNTHTGGTVVGQGLLAVSRLRGQFARPGPGDIEWRHVAARGAKHVPFVQQTVGLSGFNQDVIWGNGEAASAAAATTTDFVSWNWYEHGVSGTTQGLPVNSGEAPRTFTSAFNPSVQFQFADYGSSAGRNDNALLVPSFNSGTITLNSPGSFQSLQFLAAAKAPEQGRLGMPRSTFPMVHKPF